MRRRKKQKRDGVVYIHPSYLNKRKNERNNENIMKEKKSIHFHWDFTECLYVYKNERIGHS